MASKITLEELRAELASGAPVTLVEALPEPYYRKEHLPGAINVPHDRVDELAGTLMPNKDATIVVYCANGPCPNSGIAAQQLTELGYSDVRDYHEGKQEWIEAGLPTERGRMPVAA
jgi:rhodanese-related sulfurtransferase